MTFHYERRLGRAIYHLECLETEIDLWLEERPYRTWTEPDIDSTKELLWAEILKPPPAAKLSLIIGDCLHNLRSALDNLAFELAIAYKRGGYPRVSRAIRGFPSSSRRIQANSTTCSGASIHARRQSSRTCNRTIDGRGPPTILSGSSTSLPSRISTACRTVTPFARISHLSFVVPGGPGADEIEPINFTVEDCAPIAAIPPLIKPARK